MLSAIWSLRRSTFTIKPLGWVQSLRKLLLFEGWHCSTRFSGKLWIHDCTLLESILCSLLTEENAPISCFDFTILVGFYAASIPSGFMLSHCLSRQSSWIGFVFLFTCQFQSEQTSKLEIVLSAYWSFLQLMNYHLRVPEVYRVSRALLRVPDQQRLALCACCPCLHFLQMSNSRSQKR